MAQILNVSVYQRETKTLFNLDFATNITEYHIYFSVKSEIASAAALISKIVTTHTNAATGLTSVSVTEADTNIAAGDYYYEVAYAVVTNENPFAISERVTLLTGMFSVLPSVIGEITA
jgi:hypothetical protein